MNTLSRFTLISVWFCGVISAVGLLLFILTPTVFTESLTIQDDSAVAGFHTASADATLSSLTLADISFNEPFSPGRTTYTAETPMSTVLVGAVATHDGATVDLPGVNSEDGYRVVLEEGETDIVVSVTAEDGRTTETYTITVTKLSSTSIADETTLLIESEPESDTQTDDDDIGTIDRIIATPGDGEVTVTWASSDTTNVTGWQFAHRTQATSSETWADVPSSTASTTSHTITSLTNGTAYLFKIRAKGSGATRGTEAEAVATPNTGIPATDFDSNDNNLIEITTLEQLNAIRYDLNGDSAATGDTPAKNNTYYSAFKTSRVGFFCDPGPCAGYELMNDLDFDTDGDGRTWYTNLRGYIEGDSDDAYYNGGSGWEPIGGNSEGNQFISTFDGNGYVIKNLYIRRPYGSETGLFGYVFGSGVLTAVGLVDVYVRGGPYNTGSLSAVVSNGGVVRASFATGRVLGREYVGGLVGSSSRGIIESSYSMVDVNAGTSFSGGLISSSSSSEAVIRNSYAIGAVTSYGTKGGLVASSSATVTNSYWNTETSGQSDSAAGTGKTTAELQTPTGYTGIYSTWDDNDIDGVTGTDAPWDFGTNKQYPLLTFGGHTIQKQLPKVTSIIATPGDTQVTLTWKAENTRSVAGWEFAYKTQVAADWESWADVPSSTASTTSHVITSLTNDTPYLFKIRMKGSGGTRVVESVVAVATPGATIPATDFDANDNGLIDITTLTQLDAVRHDLDGDGAPSGTVANKIAYHNVFKTSQVGFLCGTPCTGYELLRSLDFDTDGDGSTWTGTVNNPTADSDDTYYNSGKGWIPIGGTYTAIFDGNGYTIDNLFVKRGNSESDRNSGFFREIGTGGIVRNLGLRNVALRSVGNAGGIASINRGTIQTSFVTGETFAGNTGLIVSNNHGTILHSYSRGIVRAGGDGTTSGGIAGNRLTNEGTIKNSWTATIVTVTGTGTSRGGIVSRGTTTITNSYFDTDVYEATGTNGKTTTELQSPTGYTGIYATWDDDNLDGIDGADSPWDFGTNSEYPILTFGGHSAVTQQYNIVANPGNAQVTISWTTVDLAGVTGWQVAYKADSDGTWGSWTDVPDSTIVTRSHVISSLTNGTTYLFKVRAKLGTAHGTESAEAIATPGATVPVVDFDSNNNNLIDITTLAQLNAVRYDLDGNGIPSGTFEEKNTYYNAFKTSHVGFFCDACAGYELMNELDFDTDDDGSTWTEVNSVPTGDSDDTYNNSGSGWEPIGSSSGQFATTFDGNGFVISNLYISRGSSSNVGLFGVVSTSGVVTAVALKDVFVAGGTSTGALAGRNDGTISVSYTAGSVTGESNNTGGLVGLNNNGTIIASYSAASVSANAGTNHRVGGLVGSQNGSSAAISNSYSIGSVTGGGTNVGGLLGRNNAGSVTVSFWNTETSGQTSSPGGGTGKTTTQLQTPTDYWEYDELNDDYINTIYLSWDDDDIDGDGEADAPWNFGTDSQYPVLIFGGHQADVQRGSGFTLDLDKSGTFVSRQDLLGTYLYLAEGISITQLRTYTYNQEQSVATEMAELIDGSITGAAPPLDLDGNDTVSARLDVLGAYLYTAEGISRTQLRAYTHDQEQSTANTMANTIDALIE